MRLAIAFSLLCAPILVCGANNDLSSGFADPPREAKPHTWWHWMNGNVTKEGISADLEAMKEIGLGGVQLFDIGYRMPRGNVDFASRKWFDCAKHAVQEAKRLGLDFALNTGSGWSIAGGPWNVLSNGMKFVTFSEKSVKGPLKFIGKLPELPFEGNEKSFGSYFRDVAVIAVPKSTADASEPLADFWHKIFRINEQEAPFFGGRKAAGGVVNLKKEVDVTANMTTDGTLNWDVPEGEWTILRIGYCANGRPNHPASDFGRGLECDKLSAKALDLHWAGFLDRLFGYLGPNLVGRGNGGVTGIVLDSYEAGPQNWTDEMEGEFERRVGYSLRPWLPVFAGRIVESREMTERFLEDFRRVVSDMFIENFGFAMRRKAHAYGLDLYVEPYGGEPAIDLEYAHCADVPMTEFWTGKVSQWRGGAAPAVSEAQVWGKKIVAAEAYTSWPKDDRWTLHPAAIKRLTDYWYCCGVNRIVYHTYAHQPWMDRNLRPGMTMARFGIMFNRNVAWWEMGREWIKYQTRCQYMLQQGKAVADAFFFIGEGAPCPSGVSGRTSGVSGRKTVGQGADCLSLTKEALMASKAENGRLVAPSGVSARFLILPGCPSSPEVMRKIECFAKSGIVLVGELPERAFGLRGFPKADHEVRRISVGLKAMSKVLGLPTAEAVRKAGFTPDFICMGKAVVTHAHRTAEDGSEIYFVAAQTNEKVSIECSFRVSGRTPEIWDPMTGKIAIANKWREDGARVVVSLDFDPDGSMFVVFRPRVTIGAAIQPTFNLLSEELVEGPWGLSFPVQGCTPVSRTLDRLVSWTDSDEETIRFFSGTATYRKKIRPLNKRPCEHVFLDLGDVRNVCEVTVNGKTFPTLWKRPYRVDVTDAIEEGESELVIRVANVDANRLIGDERKPDDCSWTDKGNLTCWPEWMTNAAMRASGRVSFATWRHWSKDDQPLPSGLMGPVRLLFEMESMGDDK